MQEDTSLKPPVHPLDMADMPYHPESVWFWVDCRKEDDRCMSTMCQKCHDEKAKDIGWFWHGSLGYGPFDIVCDLCGEKIHEHKQEE